MNKLYSKKSRKIRGGGAMLIIVCFLLFTNLVYGENLTLKVVSLDTWEPFNLQQNGKLSGIGVDYWKIVSKKLNIKTTYKIEPKWDIVLKDIKNGKGDLTLSTGITKDREKYAVFSKPYCTMPIVIATKDKISFVPNIQFLQNKKIAVGKNYTSTKLLKENYPNLKLVEVENIDKALELLKEGKVFAVIDVLPVLSYKISKYNYYGIRISGKTDLNFKIRFMLNKKYKYLIPKINKTIDEISFKEKLKIYNKWIKYKTNGLEWKDIKLTLIIGIIVILIFLILIAILFRMVLREKSLHHKMVILKDKAEKLAKAKSEFLANMSHEIRTPLNAMFGFLRILQEKDLDKESLKYLNIIEKSGENLLVIINDILDFSKLESGKFQIENIEFNPKEEIEIIQELFASKASEKDILLKITEENIKYNIISDPTRLKQVVANLLSNAIKFTPVFKTISLNIKYNDIKETLFVEVVDEGIGIKKEKLETIFEAFSQADNSTTRKYGGTGLGLTISYKLIKLLGGELKVESEEGKGSRFYFEIPVKKNSIITEKLKEKKKIKYQQHKYHILLVEDNKANQMFMKVMLKKLGITFDIANDGLEAIDLFKKNRYDYILMDENMPNMDGITATKEIRMYEKENMLQRTMVIALTANALAGDKERFILAGMDYYLSKPLDLDKLEEIFQEKGKF